MFASSLAQRKFPLNFTSEPVSPSACELDSSAKHLYECQHFWPTFLSYLLSVESDQTEKKHWNLYSREGSEDIPRQYTSLYKLAPWCQYSPKTMGFLEVNFSILTIKGDSGKPYLVEMVVSLFPSGSWDRVPHSSLQYIFYPYYYLQRFPKTQKQIIKTSTHY